jgi:hypothetical protein
MMPAELETTMDSTYQKAELNNADALAQSIEDQIPAAKVSNLGWLVLVRLENGSIFTLAPLTSETCDLNGTDCQDRKHELQTVAWNDALKFLQDVATLQTEDATPPGVAAYSPANAFASNGQTSNRGVEQSKREGWQVVNEIDRLKFTRGEDPLGQDAMNGREKKRSEGKKKSAIAHNFENGSPLSLGENSTAGNETLSYLAELLPCDSAEIEGNKLTVTADAVSIVITQQGGDKFSVQSFVGGDPASDVSNIGAAETIKLCFQICGMVQSKVAESDDTGADDVSSDDVFSTLKELAKENGESDDIIRNKSLFDLKQGLTVAKKPFTENTFGPKHQTPAVHGATKIGNHPVSINEHRDASKPYADTLGGKVLVDFGFPHGVQLVDKKDLPKQNFLSWNSNTGQIELVEGRENVKRPSWHFRGWKH